MSEDGRYELKFVLDEGRLTDALHWLYTSVGVVQKYEERCVNSLYFDDITYQSARDNLAGVADRKKVRLRWYDYANTEECSDVALELKIRKGRLGYKKVFQLPNLEKILFATRTNDLLKNIRSELSEIEENSELIEEILIPVLLVVYDRKYYESAHGIRITIDRNIKFHQSNSHEFIADTIKATYPQYIMELKFPPALKNVVGSLLRKSHLTPKRHSKYMVGLATFGQVIYI